MAEPARNPSASAFVEFAAGEIAVARGDDLLAIEHLQRSIRQAADGGSRFVDGLARVTLATVEGTRGRAPESSRRRRRGG